MERDLTWASTYGNHDSDYNLSRAAILAREQTYSNSLTKSMVSGTDAGVSNYYLEVFSADTSVATPELILWFFDSRGGNYYQELDSAGGAVPQPNWVDTSVVDWFTETNAALQTAATVIPAIAFVHIPVQAMLAFQGTTVSATKEPGINDDVPLAQQGAAQGQGTVSGTTFTYANQDVPFMQALLDTEGLSAVFSGHDHGDDWYHPFPPTSSFSYTNSQHRCFKWSTKLPGMTLTGNGLDLCFGRHSGYGGYGTWTRGSRQILLSLTAPIQTWIRLIDSSITGAVTLNSTFGTDVYPVVTG